MRGKQVDGIQQVFNITNIPAYAGKTGVEWDVFVVGGEHPRVCGENYDMLQIYCVNDGTSPRMRGKP